MAPKNSTDDPYMAALNTLQRKVDAIALTQESHARSIKWITSAALLIVGAVAGPDAVTAITGGPV
jgi:hypothetical protein